MITQTLLSHAGLPRFETLNLNPNTQYLISSQTKIGKPVRHRKNLFYCIRTLHNLLPKLYRCGSGHTGCRSRRTSPWLEWTSVSLSLISGFLKSSKKNSLSWEFSPLEIKKTQAQQSSARKAGFLNLSISMNQSYNLIHTLTPTLIFNNQTHTLSFTFTFIIPVGVKLAFIFCYSRS